MEGEVVGSDKRPPYLERFIHAGIYEKRPDIMAVVHSHAEGVLPFTISKTPLVPVIHSAGDMGLAGGVIVRDGPRLTYGNIAVFHPRMFDGIEPGTWLKLFPWAYRFVEEGRVTGERYTGVWDNIGTAAQLADLDRRLKR